MTIPEWQLKFREKVEELMRENGMKQAHLAKACGVSAGRLNEYISMKAMPNIFVIINMADVFGVSISELIDFGERIDIRRT